jgi:hypothetical protein
MFSSNDTNNKRVLASSVIAEVKRHHGKNYPHALNFYSVPPTEEITIDEFESFAFDRLQGKIIIYVKYRAIFALFIIFFLLS